MKAAPELTPEEQAKVDRQAKADAEMKRKKEELLARKAAKKAAAEGGGAAPGAEPGPGPAPGGASPEGQARPRVSSASRRRGTAFVKPDAVPDAHDIAELEKNEGVKETSKGGGKPAMERRGTGFVNKQQVAAHIAANDGAEEPKKKSSMCILS